MLESLIGETSSHQQQAVTRAELAFRAFNDVDRVDELLQAALRDVGNHSILPVIHANLAWVALCRLEPASAADHARAAIELAQDVSEVSPLRLGLGALGEAEALMGLDPVPTMRRAGAITAEPSPGESVLPARLRGEQLLWEGRIDDARRSIREADLQLVDAGQELMRHDTLCVLTQVECAAGDWTRRRATRRRGVRHRCLRGPRGDPGSDVVREVPRRGPPGAHRRCPQGRNRGGRARRGLRQSVDGGREPERSRVPRPLRGRSGRSYPGARSRGPAPRSQRDPGARRVPVRPRPRRGAGVDGRVRAREGVGGPAPGSGCGARSSACPRHRGEMPSPHRSWSRRSAGRRARARAGLPPP